MSFVHRTAALLLLGATACGAPAMPTVTPIRIDDLDAQAPPRFPLVLEVHEGDRIPVRVKLSGNLIVSPDDVAPIVLTAQRDFFVVVDEDGPKGISLDGKTLDSGHNRGSLKLGIEKKEQRPAEVLVELEQQVGLSE